jgi:uncharacterized Zn-binding protein involved in type VI secretion
MSKYDSSILDVTATSNGGYIQGGASTTVFLDGHPLVLDGSVSTSGAVVLSLVKTSTLVVEGRRVAKPGDALSDGSVLLARAP